MAGETVGELIQRLSKLDLNLPVVIQDPSGFGYQPSSVFSKTVTAQQANQTDSEVFIENVDVEMAFICTDY